MIKSVFFISVLVILLRSDVWAQFQGGLQDDGFDISVIEIEDVLYAGLSKDGHHTITGETMPQSISEGGAGDGWSQGDHSSSDFNPWRGLSADGYGLKKASYYSSIGYFGGDKDGYHRKNRWIDELHISLGGIGDGYDQLKLQNQVILLFTGTSGDGYNDYDGLSLNDVDYFRGNMADGFHRKNRSILLTPVFAGQNGDGFDRWRRDVSAVPMFSGLNEDGHDQMFRDQTFLLYVGGDFDGFDDWYRMVVPFSFIRGGQGDGYWRAEEDYSNVSISKGASRDGAHLKVRSVHYLSYYKGLDQDGYASTATYRSFIWTGAFGSYWDDPGNWNVQATPNINSPVLIPGGLMHYPEFFFDGLAVGQNPDGFLSRCKTIELQPGATMRFYEGFSRLMIYNRLELNGIIEVFDDPQIDEPSIFLLPEGDLIISSQGKIESN